MSRKQKAILSQRKVRAGCCPDLPKVSIQRCGPCASFPRKELGPRYEHRIQVCRELLGWVNKTVFEQSEVYVEAELRAIEAAALCYRVNSKGLSKSRQEALRQDVYMCWIQLQSPVFPIPRWSAQLDCNMKKIMLFKILQNCLHISDTSCFDRHAVYARRTREEDIILHEYALMPRRELSIVWRVVFAKARQTFASFDCVFIQYFFTGRLLTKALTSQPPDESVQFIIEEEAYIQEGLHELMCRNADLSDASKNFDPLWWVKLPSCRANCVNLEVTTTRSRNNEANGRAPFSWPNEGNTGSAANIEGNGDVSGSETDEDDTEPSEDDSSASPRANPLMTKAVDEITDEEALTIDTEELNRDCENYENHLRSAYWRHVWEVLQGVLADRPLIRMRLQRCDNCYVETPGMQGCQCGMVKYCGRTCQQQAWGAHRRSCSSRKTKSGYYLRTRDQHMSSFEEGILRLALGVNPAARLGSKERFMMRVLARKGQFWDDIRTQAQEEGFYDIFVERLRQFISVKDKGTAIVPVDTDAIKCTGTASGKVYCLPGQTAEWSVS